MLAKILSAAIHGVDVRTVEVEVNVVEGMMNEDGKKDCTTIIVGLPDAAIRESRERIFNAIKQSELRAPLGRVIVNLAPADLRKSGTAYDLPIALGQLGSIGSIPPSSLNGVMVIGELALNGTVRPIQGALPMAMHAKHIGLKSIILPKENALEAAAAQGIPVIGVTTLREAAAYLSGAIQIAPQQVDLSSIYRDIYVGLPDFADVKGQEHAKRALLIAAAGGHNLLMIGPPGSGKSMLCKRLPSIVPPLSMEESLEVTKVHSIAGVLDPHCGLIVRRPFRNPHHTVSDAGLVGGKAIPRPGELSLAHRGILFLDELPEFRRSVLEVMRQPLENGEVTLSRASGSFVFPAKIMLIAAMNPCPCGYYGSNIRKCTCTRMMVNAYRGRISGPLLDRIDLHVEVPALTEAVLTSRRNGESSESMRQKVFAARKIQQARYAGTSIPDNASLNGKIMDDICHLSQECVLMMRNIINELQLSARSYDRILRVARTIADLEGTAEISALHIAEAANYRILDRQTW